MSDFRWGKKYLRRGEKVQWQQGGRSQPAPCFIHFMSELPQGPPACQQRLEAKNESD